MKAAFYLAFPEINPDTVWDNVGNFPQSAVAQKSPDTVWDNSCAGCENSCRTASAQHLPSDKNVADSVCNNLLAH